MQKEIRKRAQLYGVAAIISAILLGAFAFNIQFNQPISQPARQELLATFSSYRELRNFLAANSKVQGEFTFYGPWDQTNLLRTEAARGAISIPAQTYGPSSAVPSQTTGGVTPQFSTTNIQVTGVDEADIVKTDGEYIYLVSGNSVFIAKAYPAEKAEIIKKITFSNDTYPLGIFVSQDKLTVLGSKYTNPYYETIAPWRGYSVSSPYHIDIKTFINVYDISDRTQPVLLNNFTMSGSYFNSRLIGKYVYFVASQPAYIIYDTVILPKIYGIDGIREISASEIHYSNVPDDYFMFTTVVSLNIENAQEPPTYKTIMMGGTSGMFVSLDNIYITFRETEDKTSIYRIRIENSNITIEATGKVPGHELNQYSMDEYNNYFRIATTRWINGTTENNLYALDMDLNIVGTLEKIAPGESLDSARFIGNRCYLSTSIVRKDPFFVIDVEDPNAPKILGYLKIPGFNRYLHPYDDNHIIGIGKDNSSNVKISLFDVSNVTSPVEIDNYTVPASWSDSTALTEPKAFLFDKSKSLLVIPVSTYDPQPQYSSWQGAYVFNITLTNGLVFKGSITHQETSTDVWQGSYWVKRELYIDNVLYTLSDKRLKMNSLDDLKFINELEFPGPPDYTAVPV